MKVKASLIVSAVGILRAVDTTKMKLSTSYKVRNILKECQTAIEDFEAKRVSLAEKHGTLNDDGSKYNFTDEKAQQAFQKGMQKMLDDEIDIKIKPIPFDLLDDYITIEPNNVEFVEWFISGLTD